MHTLRASKAYLLTTWLPCSPELTLKSLLLTMTLDPVLPIQMAATCFSIPHPSCSCYLAGTPHPQFLLKLRGPRGDHLDSYPSPGSNGLSPGRGTGTECIF